MEGVDTIEGCLVDRSSRDWRLVVVGNSGVVKDLVKKQHGCSQQSDDKQDKDCQVEPG